MISVFVLAVVVVVNVYLVISQFEAVKAKGLSANEKSAFALQYTTTPTTTVTLQPTYTSTVTSFPTILSTLNATATPIATAWPATAQTINSPSQPTPTIPSGEKRIIVNIADQHLYAYEGNALIYSFTISTGAEDSTQIGTFFILDKIPQAYSAPWGFWMPDWLGIYWVGDMENGIHALPVLPDESIIWGDGLGTPISHGCVILNTEDARLLFNWADIGTEVNIIK